MLKQLTLTKYLAAALLIAASPATFATSKSAANLEQALNCRSNASVKNMEKWIKDVGGGNIIESKDNDAGVEYTIPNPIYVQGLPVTKIGIRSFKTVPGRTITVYESILPDESFHKVSRVANLTADVADNYTRKVGKNQLFLREQVGVIYITCAIGIHSPSLIKALGAQEPKEENPKEELNEGAGKNVQLY